MFQDKWDQAQQIFLAIADLSTAEQAIQLNQLCADDAELRLEVESLLVADSGSDTYITSLVETEATVLMDSPAPGERVGAYRIVKEIGRGGMGAVFLATRDDDHYHKQVAIKVVKRGMDTMEVLERFRHERQILANLDHPFIARLLDGGSTRDGRPFFVMEYVDGQPLDDYCNENNLDVRARLQLFVRICHAVAYAHRNLVVHRDLKPANILVIDAETPKLLDFGVAKLLSGNPSGDTTIAVSRAFTPEYASPEQVMGLAVTTATDIYSLGAVLYELLTGKAAHTVSGSSFAEIDRAICQEPVKKPSLTAPDVDSDLDNIVLMAMRKEPDRRYQSVDQFAEDIERYLNGEAVAARQNSLWYRASKFVRRNGWQVAAACVVMASLIAATVVSTAEYRRAESQRWIAVKERAHAEAESHQAKEARLEEAKQRQLADQQRDEAQKQRARAEHRVTDLIEVANKMLFDVHNAVEGLPGAIEARRTIVRTTLEYLVKLEKDGVSDDRIRLALATAYYKIGMIQGDMYSASLQDFDGARASFLKAEALVAPVFRDHADNPEVMLAWIEVKDSQADLVYRAGEREKAAADYEKLLPIARKLGKARPEAVSAAKQEALLHWRLAVTLHYFDAARGLEHANREIALVRDLMVRFPNEKSLKQEFGVGLAVAAASLVVAGELNRGEEFYRQSIQLREDLLKSDPKNQTTQRNLIVAYGNYAGVLGIPWSPNLGRPADARIAAGKAVAMARSMAAADPNDMTARVNLAMSLIRLGTIDPEPGGMEKSLAILRESIGILQPVAKASQRSAAFALNLATAQEYAGHRLAALGKAEQAEAAYLASMALVTPFVDSGNSGAKVQQIACEQALAAFYAAKGDKPKALAHANSAVAESEVYASSQKSDQRSAHLARSYSVLASTHAHFGDQELSSRAAQKALSVWKQLKNASILSMNQAVIRDTGLLAANR